MMIISQRISSSNDSLFDDEDDHFVLGDQEEIDYYAVLNVPRNASIEDINKAYKARCLLFHPDRHTDEQSKKDAEKVFVVLRRAHETLIDPQKRAIYDAVGLRGLEMQGWQLVSTSNNPENIRREYEFLKKLRETEIMIQRIHPTSSFHVKVNAAGLFCEDPDDRYAPSLAGLSINQTVDSALASTDRIGLSGKVRAYNGRGDGQMSLSWKRSASSTLHIETLGTFTTDTASGVLKITKSISPRILVAFAPTVTYYPLQDVIDASIGTTLSMQLAHNWQGSVAFGYGLRTSYISTTILRTELNQQQCSLNLTLSPVNSFVKGTYIWRFPEVDAQLETSCMLGFHGTTVGLSYDQRLSRYSRIGCGVSLSYPACLLVGKLRLKTSLNHYELHLILCDSQDEIAQSLIFGVAAPYIVFQTAKLLFRGPLARLSKMFDDSALDDQIDEIKREDASRVSNLMRPTAERIARQETGKHGLIIVEAKYGQMQGDNPAYPLPGDRLIDVTIPLQAMVTDSQLRLYSVKGQLPGFYDPCPQEPKMLRVVYKFRDELHAVVVPEEMALNIPLSSHRISQ